MANVIENELLVATGVEKEAAESQQDYLGRLFQGVVALDNSEWAALSESAKAWYTAAVASYDAGEDIPPVSTKYTVKGDPDDTDNPDEDTTNEEVVVSNTVGFTAQETNTVTETTPEQVSESTPTVKHKRRNLSTNVDKFGFKVGSKQSTAATAFEKGATMAEVYRLTGAKHYNMLRDLPKKGHRVWQESDGRFVLKHKDLLDSV